MLCSKQCFFAHFFAKMGVKMGVKIYAGVSIFYCCTILHHYAYLIRRIINAIVLTCIYK